MAFLLSARPMRMALTALICVFVLVYMRDSLANEMWDENFGKPPPPAPAPGGSDQKPAGGGLPGIVGLPPKPTPKPGEPPIATLDDLAHRLRNPDEFKVHFTVVRAAKPLSRAQAMAGCQWPPDVKVNFQYAVDVDWVVNARTDEELAGKRTEWHKFLENDMIPWSEVQHRFKGRGIVVVAGNSDTRMRLIVLLRALVKVGSTIEVEVHYFGDELSDQIMKDLVALYPHGIHFNDLSNAASNVVHIKKDGLWGINYQLKTAALLNSRFMEPMLVDSDNIPLIPPEDLYTSATYEEYHTVFWPDIARTRPQNPIWSITDTICKMDEYEQESGQLLVDKSRFWYHLQLASWMNNEQGKYYNEFLLGDKDMFRFAWHALKTKYGRPKKWLTSVGIVNPDGGYCGNSFAQHHPDNGQVAFMHGGLLKLVKPPLMKWNMDKGGMFRNFKRAPTDEHPEISVQTTITFDLVDYWKEKPEDFGGPMCTDMPDVEVRPLDELVKGFNNFFTDIGGYWQVNGTG